MAKRLYQHTAALNKTSVDKIRNVLSLYNEGKSQCFIERELHMTRKTIRSIVEKYNDTYRSKSDQWRLRWGSTLDETKFDELNDDSLYWIGFIYADGHVRDSSKEYSIELELQDCDVEHLLKLSSFLSSNIVPHKYSPNTYTIRFYSKHMNQKLHEYGLGNRKSWNAKPNEQFKESRDFWRGVIDGDGGVYSQKEGAVFNQLFLCGTYDTVNGFIEFCSKYITTDKKPSKCKNSNNLYQVSFYKEADLLSEVLYKDANTYLNRKYETYKFFNKH